MPHASASIDHHAPGPTTLGPFVSSDRTGTCSSPEWIATLPDLTQVIVGDVRGAPSALDIEKAVSIVQSRYYLEQRARQLLLPFTKEAGTWRLATLDFGAKASRHGCQFLMGFEFRASNGILSITSPYVDIGFALPRPMVSDPVFVLTALSAVGFFS